MGTALLQPRAAQALTQGGVHSWNRCLSLLLDLSQPAIDGTTLVARLGPVARACAVYFHDCGSRIDCLRGLERRLEVPRVRADFVRFWFGRRKGFSQVEEVARIITDGADVPVTGAVDLEAALKYGNHSSVHAHSSHILQKICDDVRFGRAFIFPRGFAASIPGLRISPLGVVVSPRKVRIIHDLSFVASPNSRSVNADTTKDSAPEIALGTVLRDVVWRVLFLRKTFGTGVRIVLSKIDMTDAFRQVPVCGRDSPVFGYSFGKWVIVDRRLEFGWTNSPGNFCLLTSAIEHAHLHTKFDDAVVTNQGKVATQHITVPAAVGVESPPPFPPHCRIPPGVGGGAADNFFIRFYVDDGILVEVAWSPTGERCKRASASCATDHFRLFGERGPVDPPLFSAHKLSSWMTKLVVLGWEIDTVAMTIAAPVEKLESLRVMLQQWPPHRATASETEVRGLVGKLLHLCEVARPGRYFVRRMLNQLGLAPVESKKFKSELASRQVRLGAEFHADVAFWRLLVDGGLGSPIGKLTAPLIWSFSQPPACTLWSDASGDAMGGWFLRTGDSEGVWWRFDFSVEVRARFRTRVCGRDDLSINVLELLGMVVGAWVFLVQSDMQPAYALDSIRMRGDNSSAVSWVNKCRGGKEPRSGALMRILGCLEMGSKWRFDSLHVKGSDNTIADGISRWEYDSINHRLCSSWPGVVWREQVLEPEAVELCSEILDASSSATQLRSRLRELTSRVGGLGALFAG